MREQIEGKTKFAEKTMTKRKMEKTMVEIAFAKKRKEVVKTGNSKKKTRRRTRTMTKRAKKTWREKRK